MQFARGPLRGLCYIQPPSTFINADEDKYESVSEPGELDELTA